MSTPMNKTRGLRKGHRFQTAHFDAGKDVSNRRVRRMLAAKARKNLKKEDRQ